MHPLKQWARLGLAGFMGASALAFVGLSAYQLAKSLPEEAISAKGELVQAELVQEELAQDELGGLWLRRGEDPKLFRFYYFHGDGKGLYRYGQRELNQTNSFDYRIRNGKVLLTFRKSGARHETAFEIQGSAKAPMLRLAKDPKEPGASYQKVAGPMRPGDVPQPVAPSAGLGSSMWIHTESFAKGGGEFGMYQFNAPAMDGRGVGWFHRGDFDDWSTESFRYRIDERAITLDFELVGRSETTPFALVRGPKKSRFLQLKKDPRNYWLHRQYRFMGPSFGAHPAFSMWSDLHHLHASF